MKYFISCQAADIEYQKRFLGIPYGKVKPFLELISLNLISEDDRSIYLISNEFDVTNVWRKYHSHINKVNDSPIKTLFEESLWSESLHFSKKHFIFTLRDREECKSRVDMIYDIIRFIGRDTNPEFIGYDEGKGWVAFLQLLGNNKPSYYPSVYKDLAQDIHAGFPPKYDAKEKAEWIKDTYFNLKS